MVVLDDSAEMILSNFNLDIYSNIEGIVQLLFAGSSIVGVKSVFCLGKKYNTLELLCDNELKFQLILDYENDFFNDCVILKNDIIKVKYEFCCDKRFNCYSLKLREFRLKKNVFSKFEVLFYDYGNHINIYVGNNIFSFDIQGRNVNFDFYKFDELFEFIDEFNLEDLLQIIKLCINKENIEQILLDEYYKTKLVRSLVVLKNDKTKSRVLNLKKKKC